MKIAVSGKGGVGKTTFAALIAKALAQRGMKVLAVDADPDANLGQALGFPDYQKLVPVSEMKDLIAERTEAKDGPAGMGTFFKLNPTVHDLPDKLSVEHHGVRLMVMGTVKKGGAGCICPASTMLKTLMSHLVLTRNEAIILDMEAGLEHLGRATARGVDFLIIVVEPGRRSIDTARHIKKLAQDIGIKNVLLVGSKTRGPEDRHFLRQALINFQFLGFIDYDPAIIQADISDTCPADLSPNAKQAADKMAQRLMDMAGR